MLTSIRRGAIGIALSVGLFSCSTVVAKQQIGEMIAPELVTTKDRSVDQGVKLSPDDQIFMDELDARLAVLKAQSTAYNARPTVDNKQRLYDLFFNIAETTVKMAPTALQIYMLERLCEVAYTIWDIKAKTVLLQWAEWIGNLVFFWAVSGGGAPA